MRFSWYFFSAPSSLFFHKKIPNEYVSALQESCKFYVGVTSCPEKILWNIFMFFLRFFFFPPSFKQIWSWRFLSILWYYFFSPHFLGIQCLAEHRSLAGEQFLKYSTFGRLIGTEPRATPARQSYFSFAVYAFINTDKRQKALLQHYMQSCYIQSWNWESVLDYTVSPYQDHTTRIQSNPNTTHARWSHPVCVGY